MLMQSLYKLIGLLAYDMCTTCQNHRNDHLYAKYEHIKRHIGCTLGNTRSKQTKHRKSEITNKTNQKRHYEEEIIKDHAQKS